MSLPEAVVTENSPRPESISETRNHTLTEALLLAGGIVLGAVLRFLFLAKKSFWFDEGVSVQIARLDWYNFARILWRREANMSLYYVLLRGWLHFGSSEAFVRSLSALFATLTLPAMYCLGRRLFDSRTGQIATLLLACNAFHIAYSQEARSYSLLALLSVLSVLFFVESLEKPSSREFRLHVAASALAVYAHLFALLLVVAEWLGLRFLDPAPRPVQMKRHWLRIAALIAPLLLFVITTGTGPLAWIPRPGLHDLYHLLVALCGNGGWLLAVLYLAACIWAVVPVDQSHSLQRFPGDKWRPRFALLWLLFPPLAIFAISQVKPLFLPRYFVFVVPALTLLAARGLSRPASRWLRTTAIVLFLALSLRAAYTYYAQDSNLEREDWRSVAGYVLSHSEEGDALIFHTGMGRMPYEYYRRNLAGPRVLYPHNGDRIAYRDFVSHLDSGTLAAAALDNTRIWVIFSHREKTLGAGSDAVTARITQFLGSAYPKVQIQSFPGVEVYLYSGGRRRTGHDGQR